MKGRDVGELVEFRSNGDSSRGHLAVPAGGAGPGVVLLQEWWGLVPHVVDLAERLADEGFVVLAPDLYRGETTTEPDEAMKKLMALDLPRAARDIASAARYLVSRDEVSSPRVGAVGFCMGGSLALWSGAISDAITATVPFYPAMPTGALAVDWSAYAGKRVLMHLAEGDGGSGSPEVQAAYQALTGAGADVEMHDYVGSHHAFVNDTRPDAYQPEHAALAWSRTVEFLRAHLTA